MTSQTHIRTIIRNYVEGYVQALQDTADSDGVVVGNAEHNWFTSLAIAACVKRYSHNPEFFAAELQAVVDYANEVLPKQPVSIGQELVNLRFEETKRD